MEKEEKSRDLKVYIRFLPSTDICRENLKYNLETNTIYLRCNDAISQRVGLGPMPPQYWNFNPNKVFHNASQKDVYDEVTKGILDNSISNGTNAAILAYGQVGSGKSFTMMGIRNKFYHRGLIPRFITDVLRSSKRSDMKISCDISFIEIFGQKATDLFTGESLKLKDLRMAPTIPLTSISTLERLFHAESRRKLADSVHFSNRGHGIVTFHLRTLDLFLSNAKYQLVKIHFVDLAGVGSYSQMQDSRQVASDIGKSNITKFFLDQCARHLEKPPMAFVSDLAVRFLGELLSENSTLRFIGNVKMCKPDLAVSLSILRFSSRIGGIKCDKKTPDPSLSPCNQLESLKSLKALVQIEAMLRNYSDYPGSENHVLQRLQRSKAQENLECDLKADVLVKKTEETLSPDDDPDRLAESLGVYDPPIPTDFDFENDPLFNYHTCTQEEFASQYDSHLTLKRPQNDMPAQIESQKNIGSRSVVISRSNIASRTQVGSRLPTDSRQRVESRLRFGSAEPPPSAQDYQYKADSLLQNLVSLKIAKEVASQLDVDGKPLKAELFNLFENKLDREKRSSDLYIVPLSVSKSTTVASKRMSALKGPASQGNIRKGGSRKNVRPALSAGGMTGRRHSNNLTTPVGHQEREIGASSASEINRRMEAKPTNANEAANVSEPLTRRQTLPLVPTPSLDSLHREEEVAANKLLRKALDDVKQDAARKRTEYFEITRKLEWCRHQWDQANSDLKEVQEKRRLAGAELSENKGQAATISRETRLAEFMRAKRQEFLEIQKKVLACRGALNNALILVDQTQKNLDKSTIKLDVQRRDVAELIVDQHTDMDEMIFEEAP